MRASTLEGELVHPRAGVLLLVHTPSRLAVLRRRQRHPGERPDAEAGEGGGPGEGQPEGILSYTVNPLDVFLVLSPGK